MNFDLSSWEKSKLIRWGVLSLIGISVEEYLSEENPLNLIDQTLLSLSKI